MFFLFGGIFVFFTVLWSSSEKLEHRGEVFVDRARNEELDLSSSDDSNCRLLLK